MRTRYVTRTIKSNTTAVTVCNLDTQGIETQIIEIPAAVSTPKEVEKFVRSSIDTDTRKAVVWSTIGTSEKRFGMPEDMFLRLADEMPLLGSDEIEE